MLCTALCVCSLMSSYELYAGSLKKSQTARELAETVDRIIMMLRYGAADVYEICRSAFSDSEEFKAFRSINGGDFGAQWKAACDSIDADDDSKRLFERVGRILGTSDAESQAAVLGGVSKELYEHAKELKERAERSKRLYLTFGAAIGLGISIMII